VLTITAHGQFSASGRQSGSRQASRRSGASAARTGVPDKALMQKIWDGWGTLDPNNVAQYYDKSPDNVFYDITPVKYDGWEEYQKGTAALRDMFNSAKFTVNDDARVHSSGDGALGTATVAAQLTGKDGKTQNTTLRWTVVWASQGGQWLIVHEHVSAPLPQGNEQQ
jgi:ketosteroid isomerase-like protein